MQSLTGTLGDNISRAYSSGIVYDAASRMTKEQFGTTILIYNKLFYNSRGQLAEIREGTTYTSASDTGWERGAIINHYSDHCWGMCSNHEMSDNNGNLKQQDHWIQDGNGSVTAIFGQQYDYDSLNRLQKVSDDRNSPTWRQQYVYDRYGNRTIDQTNTLGTGIPKPNFGVDTGTNRLTAPAGYTMGYDAAGNLTNDIYTGQGQRTYDTENRMTQAWANGQWQTYTYDGDGRRVARTVNGVVTWQVYGPGGELLAEYAQNADRLSPQKEYGYRNGQLLVTATIGTGWGSPPTYTAPDPLVAGVEIKLEHLTELRTALNQLRAHAGLAAATFTVDPNPERHVTFVKADHILQLRVALEGARSHLGLSTGGYAHPGLQTGDPIYAIDFQELRNQIATAWSSVQVNWLVSDQVGTPRMIFDESGSLAGVSRHDYLPFGEELFAGAGGRTAAQGYTANDNVRQHFTQKERDNETGLDYFGARYYASTQGRFTSPDPMMASAKLSNPQTMNRYVYVINNPLRYLDPDGLDKVDGSDPWSRLTSKEQLALAPKLTTVQEGYVPNKEQLAAARDAFNNKVIAYNADHSAVDLKQTGTNVASLKAFVAELGSNKQAWAQVDKIGEVTPTGVGRVSGVNFTVKNNDAFIGALKADPRFRYRESDMGHTDSFRSIGLGPDDPSFHVDRSGVIFGSHWDPTSSFNLESEEKVMNGVFAQNPMGVVGGLAEMASAGLQHLPGKATVEQVQKYLTPSKH